MANENELYKEVKETEREVANHQHQDEKIILTGKDAEDVEETVNEVGKKMDIQLENTDTNESVIGLNNDDIITTADESVVGFNDEVILNNEDERVVGLNDDDIVTNADDAVTNPDGTYKSPVNTVLDRSAEQNTNTATHEDTGIRSGGI